MRISPVTGDLPAVVSPAPALPTVADPPAATGPAVAAVDAASGAGAGSASDRRRPQTPLPVFDPPLIAQRAVLGLPIGGLVAGLAADRGIPHAAAVAIVEREIDDVRGARASRTGEAGT